MGAGMGGGGHAPSGGQGFGPMAGYQYNPFGGRGFGQTSTGGLGKWGSAFNNAGDVFGQSAAGFGGAMNGAFQGQNYIPLEARASGYRPTTISKDQMQQGSYNAAQMRAPGGYQADQVDPGAYASQTLQNTDIGSYMNPYTDNVIDTSLADIERARQMQGNMADAQATSSGAFGGSRQALMKTENNRNFLDQSARTAAGLRQSGYQNAQQAAMSDINNQNQASQFNLGLDAQGQMANQGANAQASQFNRQMKMTEAMNNQAAKNQAGQFNAGNMQQYLMGNMNAMNQAGQFNSAQDLQAQGMNQQQHADANRQRLQSSQLLGTLSNLGFGMGQQANGMMGQSGQQMQNMNQQLINAAKGQFQGFSNAPQQSMQTLMSALQGMPIPQSGTTSQQPGVTDIMGGLMAMFSDERLKEDVQKIGTYPGTDHGLYTWKWNSIAKALGINSPAVGVLAQEVQKTQPELIRYNDNGYMMVNYGGLA